LQSSSKYSVHSLLREFFREGRFSRRIFTKSWL